MSNSASDDNDRPTLTSVEAQPNTDTAIAAFVSELQQAWDQRDASISNRHFAADGVWAAPMAPLSTVITSCTRFIRDSNSKAPAELPPAMRSSAPSQSLMMSSSLTSRATPSIPKATQSSPVPIPRVRSQKWRSTSWFAATEHGGSPQAKTHQSDQAAPSNPMVTIARRQNRKGARQEDVESDYLLGDSSQRAVCRFVGSPALSNKRLRCKARTLRLQETR